MGTVINTNVTALNSHRSMKIVGENTQKASEKLSSGMRINRAGDDAAGLAISEKMRSQIRGLNQASRNSQDGISLIQTAEGALQETEDMLQRMRELVNQAANDTNEASDRDKIALELDQLSKEIDATAEKTEFNKKKLIDGSWEAKQLYLQVGANELQNISFGIEGMNSSRLGVTMNEIGTVVRNATNDGIGTNVQGSFPKVTTGAAAATGLGVNTTEAANAAGLGAVSQAAKETGLGTEASVAAGLGGSQAAQVAAGGTKNQTPVRSTGTEASMAAGIGTQASQAAGLGTTDTQASQAKGAGGSQASAQAGLGGVIGASEASQRVGLGYSAGETATTGTMKFSGDNTLTFNADGSVTVSGKIDELGLDTDKTLTAEAAADALKGKTALLDDGDTIVIFDSTGKNYKMSDLTTLKTLTISDAGLTESSFESDISSGTATALTSLDNYKFASSTSAGTVTMELSIDATKIGSDLITSWTDLDSGTVYDSIDDLNDAINTQANLVLSASDTSHNKTFKLMDSAGNLMQIKLENTSPGTSNEAKITITTATAADVQTALAAASALSDSINTQQKVTESSGEIDTLKFGSGEIVFKGDGSIVATTGIEQLGISAGTPIDPSQLAGQIAVTSDGDFIQFNDDATAFKKLKNTEVDSSIAAATTATSATNKSLSTASSGNLVTDATSNVASYSYSITEEGKISLASSDKNIDVSKLVNAETGEIIDLSEEKTLAEIGFKTGTNTITLADQKGNLIKLTNSGGTSISIATGALSLENAIETSIKAPEKGSMAVAGGGTLIFKEDGSVTADGEIKSLGISQGDIDSGNVGQRLVGKTIKLTDGMAVQFQGSGSDVTGYKTLSMAQIADSTFSATGTAITSDTDTPLTDTGFTDYEITSSGSTATEIKIKAAPNGVDASKLINVKTGETVDLSNATALTALGLNNTNDKITLMDQNGDYLQIIKDATGFTVKGGTVADLNFSGGAEVKTKPDNGTMALANGEVLSFAANGDVTVTDKETGTPKALTADDLKNQTLELADGGFVKFNSTGDAYKLVDAADKGMAYTSVTNEEVFITKPEEGTMKVANGATLKFHADGRVTSDGAIKALDIDSSDATNKADISSKLADTSIVLKDGSIVKFDSDGAYSIAKPTDDFTLTGTITTHLDGTAVLGNATGADLDAGKAETGYKYNSVAGSSATTGSLTLIAAAGANTWTTSDGETYNDIDALNTAIKTIIDAGQSLTTGGTVNGVDGELTVVDNLGNVLKLEVTAGASSGDNPPWVKVETAKDVFANVEDKISTNVAASGSMVLDGGTTITFNDNGTVTVGDGEVLKDVNGKIILPSDKGDGTFDSTALAGKTLKLADGDFIKFNDGGTSYKKSTGVDPSNIDYDKIKSDDVNFKETAQGTMVMAGGATLEFAQDGTIKASGAIDSLGITENDAKLPIDPSKLAGMVARLGDGSFVKFNDDGSGYKLLSKDTVTNSATSTGTNVTNADLLAADSGSLEVTRGIGGYSYDIAGGNITLTNSDTSIDTSKLINVENGKSFNLKDGASLSDLGISTDGSEITLMDQKGNLLNFKNTGGNLTITSGSVGDAKGAEVSIAEEDGTMVLSNGAKLIFNSDGKVTASGAVAALGIEDIEVSEGADVSSKLAGQNITLADGTSVIFSEDGKSYSAGAAGATFDEDNAVKIAPTDGTMVLKDGSSLSIAKDGTMTASKVGMKGIDNLSTTLSSEDVAGKILELANGKIAKFNDAGDGYKIIEESLKNENYDDIDTKEIIITPSADHVEKGTMELDNNITLKFFDDGSVLKTDADGNKSEIQRSDLANETLTLADGKTTVTFNEDASAYEVDGVNVAVSTVPPEKVSGTMTFSGGATLNFNEDGTVSASDAINELGINAEGTVTAATLKNKTAQLADGTFVQFNSAGDGYKITAKPGLTAAAGPLDANSSAISADLGGTGYQYSITSNTRNTGGYSISFDSINTGVKNVDGTAYNTKDDLAAAVNGLDKGEDLTIIDDGNNVVRFSKDSTGALSISTGKLDFSASPTIRIESAKANADDLVKQGAMKTLDGAIVQFTADGKLSVTGALRDTSSNTIAPPQSGTSYNLAESVVDQAKFAGVSILTDKGTITFGADGKTATLDPNKTSAGLVESGEHKTRNGSTVTTDSTGKVIGVTGKLTTHDGAEIGDGAVTNIEDLAGKTVRLEDGRYLSFDASLKAKVGDDLSSVPNTQRNELAEKADAEAAAALEENLNSGEVSAGKTISALLVKIDAAIESVSSQRANLGALQNRLEHTIKNVDTASENLSAAESRIRDTDMASEMMNFTKSNVLSQAAMSMLAQANQAPNNVLSLLR